MAARLFFKRRVAVFLAGAGLAIWLAVPFCSVRKVVLWVNVVIHHDEAFVAIDYQYLGQRRSLVSRIARSFIWAGDDNIGEDFTLWHLRGGKLQSFTVINLAQCSPFVVDNTLYCEGRLHGDDHLHQIWKWTGQNLEQLSKTEFARSKSSSSQMSDGGFSPKSEWLLKSHTDLHGENSDKRTVITPFPSDGNRAEFALERPIRTDKVTYWERLGVRFLSPKQTISVLYSVNRKAKQVSRAEYEAVTDDLYKP